MNVRTDIQIIHDRNGAPAFVVVPYADWLANLDFHAVASFPLERNGRGHGPLLQVRW